MLAYAYSSFTTPSPAIAGAPPPPPYTIVIFVCCAQQGARCAVRGRRTERGRCTCTLCKHAWEHQACFLSPLATPASATKIPQQTKLAPEFTRGAWEGVPAGTRDLPTCALFAKPRPPPGRAEMLCPAPIALCSNGMLSHLFGSLRNGRITRTNSQLPEA